MQCLTPDEVRTELAAGGMELVEVLGDVAGAPYDAAADSFAVVAGRP